MRPRARSWNLLSEKRRTSASSNCRMPPICPECVARLRKFSSYLSHEWFDCIWSSEPVLWKAGHRECHAHRNGRGRMETQMEAQYRSGRDIKRDRDPGPPHRLPAYLVDDHHVHERMVHLNDLEGRRRSRGALPRHNRFRDRSRRMASPERLQASIPQSGDDAPSAWRLGLCRFPPSPALLLNPGNRQPLAGANPVVDDVPKQILDFRNNPSVTHSRAPGLRNQRHHVRILAIAPEPALDRPGRHFQHPRDPVDL